jgi:hypothetical protein
MWEYLFIKESAMISMYRVVFLDDDGVEKIFYTTDEVLAGELALISESTQVVQGSVRPERVWERREDVPFEILDVVKRRVVRKAALEFGQLLKTLPSEERRAILSELGKVC